MLLKIDELILYLYLSLLKLESNYTPTTSTSNKENASLVFTQDRARFETLVSLLEEEKMVSS